MDSIWREIEPCLRCRYFLCSYCCRSYGSMLRITRRRKSCSRCWFNKRHMVNAWCWKSFSFMFLIRSSTDQIYLKSRSSRSWWWSFNTILRWSLRMYFANYSSFIRSNISLAILLDNLPSWTLHISCPSISQLRCSKWNCRNCILNGQFFPSLACSCDVYLL